MANQRITAVVVLSLLLVPAGKLAAGNQPVIDRTIQTINFRNPRKDATLYLEFDARTDLFNPPQQVTLSLGGPSDAVNSRQTTIAAAGHSAGQTASRTAREIDMPTRRHARGNVAASDMIATGRTVPIATPIIP